MANPRSPAYLSSIHFVHGEMRHIREIPELAKDAASLRYLLNLGIEKFSVQDRTPLDVLDEATRGSLGRSGLNPGEIDATIFFSTMFDLEREHNDIATLSHKVGLSRSVSFGMFLNQCTNYSQCLMFARHLLESEGFRNILLIGTDRLHGPFARTMPNNTSVYSDVAVCCLVSAEDRGEYRINGIKHKYLPEMAALGQGRDIVGFIEKYSFGFKSVCQDLYGSLETGPERFKHLITANYNQSVLRNLCRFAGMEADRLYARNVPRFGHCFSSDHLIALETLREENGLEKGDLLNLVAVGGFWTYSAICVEKS